MEFLKNTGRKTQAAIGWLGIMFFLAMAGCEPQRQVRPLPEPLSAAAILAQYQANIASIPPFRAFVKKWEVNLLDSQGKKHNYKDSFGKVFYHPPLEAGGAALVHLQADTALGSVFVIASNQKEYWIYSKNPKQNMAQWGKYEHLGKPCAENMPMNPQILLEYIGLRPLSPDPNQVLEPVYDPQTNSFSIIAAHGEGTYLKRKMVFDRYTYLVCEITEFDPEGNILMQSTLGDYQLLEPSRIPGDILLRYPADDTYIHLKLHRFRADPADRTKLFERPVRIAGMDADEYLQIDKPCENE